MECLWHSDLWGLSALLIWNAYGILQDLKLKSKNLKVTIKKNGMFYKSNLRERTRLFYTYMVKQED
ncbi:MAG: hypothetical protein WCK13_13225 [Ignavibacteriota bacterium]